MERDRLPSTVMRPPAVTLTFDLLTPKFNQHICEPKYTCDQNWVKFPSLFLDMMLRTFSERTDSDSLTVGHTRKQNAS